MNVFFSDEQDHAVDGNALRHFAEVILAFEGLAADAEMALILVNPDQMAAYNRQFMNREGPTDVLAFPTHDLVPGLAPVRVANDPPMLLGDVFLCPAEVRRRAAAQDLAFEDFLMLLVAHGILHLLGYDHDTDPSAERMEDRETALMAEIGRVAP